MSNNGASANGQVSVIKDGSAADPVEKSRVTALADAPPTLEELIELRKNAVDEADIPLANRLTRLIADAQLDQLPKKEKGKKSLADADDELEERKEKREWIEEQKKTAQIAMQGRKDFGVRRTEDGTWYRKIESGRWIKSTVTEIKTRLSIQGISLLPDSETGLSPADLAMHNMVDYALVDYAQEIAGFVKPGEYWIGNDLALVTKGAVLIPLKAGQKVPDFIDLWNFLENAFVKPDQLDAFLGWLQQAVRTLRTAKPPKWAHGVALILIGLSGIGKTSLQHLITKMLAGRMADPKLSFKGGSTFNSQLTENEHWMMSDPGHKGTKAERDAFLSSIKESVANVWTDCHPKGKPLINLPIFRRLSISLNPDPNALAIIQGMEQGTLEKTIILDFSDGGKFRPDGPEGMTYSDWEDKMQEQIPYFLDWLLNSYSVPTHLAHERYGVRYTNPTYAPQLAAPSLDDQDREMQEIVRIAVFAKDNDDNSVFKTTGLTAGEVQDRLSSTRNPARDRVNEHPGLRSSSASSGVLRKWLKDAKEIKKENELGESDWVKLDGFEMRRREIRKSIWVFDFKLLLGDKLTRVGFPLSARRESTEVENGASC